MKKSKTSTVKLPIWQPRTPSLNPIQKTIRSTSYSLKGLRSWSYNSSRWDSIPKRCQESKNNSLCKYKRRNRKLLCSTANWKSRKIELESCNRLSNWGKQSPKALSKRVKSRQASIEKLHSKVKAVWGIRSWVGREVDFLKAKDWVQAMPTRITMEINLLIYNFQMLGNPSMSSQAFWFHSCSRETKFLTRSWR